MGTHTLSETLGESGGPIEWVCSKGNKYKFSLLTLGNQSKFERALERKAVESLKNTKDLLDKDDYDKAISGVLKSISSGNYAFGGQEATAALRTMWGVSVLLGILGGIEPDEANRLVVENPDISKVIESVVERSFPVGKSKKEKDQTS